jgi:hypothetical protein
MQPPASALLDRSASPLAARAAHHGTKGPIAATREGNHRSRLGNDFELGSTYELSVFCLDVDTPCTNEIAWQVFSRE